MEITKREILVSIIIVFVLVIFGILIHGQIKQAIDDKNAIYNKALKIDDESKFQYGMSTNVGNAFVYGTLRAVDTVSMPEIEGSYIRIEKTTERYTKHTRTVSHTDSKGNTTYSTETYWTWDVINRELIHSEQISFLNLIFDYGKFNIVSEHYVDTIYQTLHLRDIYYATDSEYIGTIFTKLFDNTISDKTHFYEGQSIDETNQQLQSEGQFWLWLFWIVWVAMIVGLVLLFFYLENNYLYN